MASLLQFPLSTTSLNITHSSSSSSSSSLTHFFKIPPTTQVSKNKRRSSSSSSSSSSVSSVVVYNYGKGGGNGPTTSDESSSSSRFLDENGVVDDMDGYLNYLSLEYDSVWDTKPSWCQPWTILLFGTAVISCSWLVLHSTVITAGIGFLIGTWWYIFLYSYPKGYSDMIAERRKRVTEGVEDTYGSRRSNVN